MKVNVVEWEGLGCVGGVVFLTLKETLSAMCDVVCEAEYGTLNV